MAVVRSGCARPYGDDTYEGPCLHGHVGAWHKKPTGHWVCLQCRRITVAERTKADPQKKRDQVNATHKKNRAKYREQKKARRRGIVADARAARGGMCEATGCTHTDDLEWHHRDPSTRLFSVGGGDKNGYSYAKLTAEIAKCDLLCPNHHRETHRLMRLAASGD